MSDSGYAGQQQPGDTQGEFNAITAIARAMLSLVSTTTLVRVVDVTNDGGLAPVGFVDVQPLVNQVDGSGNATAHTTLHRLPYFRLQGGTNAIIIDPQVGDLGIAVFADHDIQTVNNTKAQANPGSGRRFDMADGLYIGGVLNGTPEQYIQYSGEGIRIHSPTKIRLTAPDIEITADNSITSMAAVVATTATTSITDTAPIATTTAPLIGLNGAIVQTAGAADVGSVTMVGPVHVIEEITSDTDVIAAGKSGAHHTHTENGEGSQTSEPN